MIWAFYDKLNILKLNLSLNFNSSRGGEVVSCPDSQVGKTRYMYYFVYILKNLEKDKYYIGQTENIEDRLKRHNTDRSSFTKNKGQWILVYKESYNTRSEAIKREKYIKSQKSRKFIESLIHRGVEK